ncbi:MAG TPA: gliding motility-associated C-terminal domain-containing protein, partial [Flavobacteriales bacterium]|nr:gliding motility-associated C-terminal domain-containing protein [Flavobacteriales bacterium]
IFCTFLLILLSSNYLNAQNTLVYTEDFENGPGVFGLNTTGEIGTNAGQNKWVVNNLFTGTPIYPNTISQDSTTGGLINFAPFSNYLHIQDSVAASTQNIGNANFQPNAASDRFTSTSDFCTLGLDSVRIAFYYTCEGNPGASAQLYYLADGGAWTPVPGAVFNNQTKWNYIEFYDEGFDNKNALRFGFRWTNDGSGGPTSGSMGVDGVRIVGKYAPDIYNVRLELDSISPNPVCRGDGLLLFFSNPVPLCGTGFYEVQFSSAFGNFTNYTSLGIYQLNNQNTQQILFTLPIPSNTNASPCYNIRVMRVDITPVIVSDTSICIEVINCPNQIITLQPAVLSNPTDTLCIGSVIDVPFYSLGVFQNNLYVAQLSDSNGLFPPNPNVLGFVSDNTTYPPGTIPKGNVPGLVRPQNQPIPPGCNYYIRVISSNPTTIGSVYGPFCIRECDIETNEKVDVQFCIDDVNGGDTLLTVDVGVFPPPATYSPPNEFQIQLLDFQSFGVINTGVVGSVVAVNDTVVQLSIPNLPNLFTVGLIPGNYYMRIVATNSDQNWDLSGTLVRLTIGAPNPSPLSIGIIDINTFLNVPFDGDTTICVNEAIYFLLSPYNFSSSYVWSLNNDPNFFEGGPYNPILFNGLGDYTLGVTETNFGCVGPGSNDAIIRVQGFPSASIVGPAQVCLGDTATFSVPLNQNTYYSWTTNPGSIVDSLSNTASISFPSSGTASIHMEAVNECGSQESTKTVFVRQPPLVVTSNDTSVCVDAQLTLNTADGINFKFYWSEDGQLISQDREITVNPDTTTTYVIRVTNYGSLACESADTVTVTVQYPDTGSVKTIDLCQGESATLQSDSTGISYLWSTGLLTQSITVSDSGWYYVMINQANELCPMLDSFKVNVKVCYQPLELPNVFSPNGDGMNDVFTPGQTYMYEDFNIVIYNRWGLKVYESMNPFFEWNGQDLNGNQLTDGTYFYIAKLEHHENSDLQKGTVTILGK